MKFFTITQQMVSSRSLLLGRSLNGNGNVVNSLMTAFYSSRPALAIDMSEETSSSSGLSHSCPQPPDSYLPPQIIYSLNTNATKKLYSDQLKTVENTKNSELRFSTSSKNENDKSMTPMTASNGPNDGRAPLEKILAVKEELVRHLPKFLKETHPYRLYTPDVIFENFYHEPGRVYVGALQYAIQLSLIRIKLNWKFSHARVEILKITHDESESTIKIRWRVNGIGGMKSMLQVWKFNLMKLKNSIKKETEWIDGFSILYLNKNGHIYKHTLQRVMTQEATDKAKDKKIKNLAMNTTMCSNCSCSGHS